MRSFGETWELPDGYSPVRKRTPRPMVKVRLMTCDEAKGIDYGHVKFESIHGELRECKVNGRPKTWKTRPNDVDVPVKYGMYEYATFTMRSGQWTSSAFPVVVIP